MTFDPSALRGLLALIKSSSGKIESRIRVQKEAFLLRQLGCSDFRSINFSYHYFGPYSRELSDVLQEAVAANLLSEKREDFAAGQNRYSYELSDDGEEWLQANPSADISIFKRSSDSLKNAHWRTLELASTVIFLESLNQSVDRESAFENALSLKRECKRYEKGAQQLLKELTL